MSGQGVCCKGRSLETLKQTVPQQLKSMEIYLTWAEGGWKVLEIAVVVQEQSWFLARLLATLSLWLCSGLDRAGTDHEVGVWGCRAELWAHLGPCPWPQAACCSHIPACDPAGKTPGHECGWKCWSSNDHRAENPKPYPWQKTWHVWIAPCRLQINSCDCCQHALKT